MVDLLEKAKKHLKDSNMSYWQHYIFAAKYGLLCLYHGCLFFIHASLPCFFQKNGSNLICKLQKDFKADE